MTSYNPEALAGAIHATSRWQRRNTFDSLPRPDIPRAGVQQWQQSGHAVVDSHDRDYTQTHVNEQVSPAGWERPPRRLVEHSRPATANGTTSPVTILPSRPGRTVPDPHHIANTATTRRACVLVLGGTGVGKSSFIAAALGQSQVRVGHGVESCTSECRDWEGHGITLIDTPGFNDTNRDDQDILADIGRRILSREKPAITAVLYLHRITDNRMAGSSRKNLQMMHALCGPEFHSRVIIVTTMWNQVPETKLEQAFTREAQLKTYTEPLFHGEEQYTRFDGTPQSGNAILRQVNELPSTANIPILQFEIERVRGHSLLSTTAGRVVQEDKLKRQRQLQREYEEYREARSKEPHGRSLLSRFTHWMINSFSDGNRTRSAQRGHGQYRTSGGSNGRR